MFKVLFRKDAVFAVAVCLCISYTAIGDSEHEASADTDNSEETTQVAKQRIVETRPSVGTLGTLLQKMQPSMSADSFSKLVDKTTGLNDAQKSALTSSFAKVAEKSERPAEQFQRVMGSAIAELFRGDQTPEAAKVAAPEATAQQAGQPGEGQGQQGQSGERKIPEEFKALQEQIKELQNDRRAQSERLRDGLRNRANEEAKARDGQGQGGQGGGQGQGQGQGGQGQNSGNDGGGNDGRALKALANAFKGNDKKSNNNNNNNSNNGNNNRSSGSSSDSQERERQAARERESSRSKASSDEPTNTASTDDKKKKDKKDKALEEAKNLLNQPPQESKPEMLTAGKNMGGKSSLNAIPQTGSYGGFGGGFAGIDGFGQNGGSAGGGQAAGAGAFGGAKVNGGGGVGGGADLGSMRFDSDFAGPMGGGKLGSTGPVYADGGSGGSSLSESGDAAAGFEAELAGNALAGATNRYYSNGSQVEFPTEKTPFKGNILDRYFGKTVREVCSEAAPHQVAMCHHPRGKGIVSTRLTSS